MQSASQTDAFRPQITRHISDDRRSCSCSTEHLSQEVALVPACVLDQSRPTYLPASLSLRRFVQRRESGLKTGGSRAWPEKFLNDLFSHLQKLFLSIYPADLFKMTRFSHLHEKIYLSVQIYTQICLFLQSHHFEKCSHVLMPYFFTLYVKIIFHGNPTPPPKRPSAQQYLFEVPDKKK